MRNVVWLRPILGIAAVAMFAVSASSDPSPSDRPFRTFFVTRHIDDERFMEYIETARPELVQAGNYGAMFHGYVDEDGATGWPMRLPMSGEREVLAFQREMNESIHDLGLKVVGHFRLISVLGDFDQPSGFVDYYMNRWPEDLLGDRPHDDVRELLQRDADGRPLQRSSPGGTRLELCLSSPHARQMLKQMVDLAIDHGVDGLISVYNYRSECACPYCQDAFRQWLGERLSDDELEEQLGITSLDDHTFDAIPARITGYPDPDEATALDWLAMRWAAEHFKRMYDRIFIEHGRARKPDLLLSTWNHLSNIRTSEERAFLPIELWGRGEDYFWYSGGAAFVGGNHDLDEGRAGDAWLAMLYIRALGGGKPFVMGKYDRTRMAVGMAEGYATGGLGAGRYMQFRDDAGFEVLARYTSFMHEHRELYDDAAPYADVALVLPRQSVMQGRPESLDAFRQMGQAIVEQQVLVDVVADHHLTPERLAGYRIVAVPGARTLSAAQLDALRSHADNGGVVLTLGETGVVDEQGRPRHSSGISSASPLEDADAQRAAAQVVAEMRRAGGTWIDSPWTVRSAAYTQPGRVVLHLVNYNREDGAPHNNRTGPDTERPAVVHDITVDLRLPDAAQARAVTLRTPDTDRAEPLELEFEREGERVRFTVPRVHVYAVIVIELD